MQERKQTPAQAYAQAVDNGFIDDPAQRQAVEALNACYISLQQGSSRVRGLYLYGRVGRGKTWLMDQFYRNLTVPARRQHFHHFMRDVHQRLFRLTGTADPLAAIADELAQEIQVLCFDELFVSDIADAMILGGLFQALFARGLVIVATSNQPPAQLYSDGYNRERFLPAVAALEQYLNLVSVDGEQDHRLHAGEVLERYWCKAVDHPSMMPALFAELSLGETAFQGELLLGSRSLMTEGYSDQVVWCEYAALCDQPFAALDFIELCDRFKVVLLSAVPALGGQQQAAKIARGTEDGAVRVDAGDRHLPSLALGDDSVRRFIALIDECYDRGVPVYIEADVALDKLYTGGYLAFAFRRTFSRLKAMQLESFAK
ncbi:cell division protein ZapE [Denitrificimonas sp. JX-1]|uniref:Cell division protein ZapE n=1 Tax=Denitrificimonas halotolerans TaxID=3098930 RepID=A0ABU5GRZ6_9GAMM|nr:cell division protein ZapE [Denitrificimonas sp. JX-1]MDY7219135.1 cell division protein ZapE [Denitrificimonas sp. JX-1]